MDYFRVRRYSDFQAHKYRRPPWVAVHSEIFDNEDFMSLSLAEIGLAIMVLVLASQSRPQNCIKAEGLGWRLRRGRKSEHEPDTAPLFTVGFLEPCDAEGQPLLTGVSKCQQPLAVVSKRQQLLHVAAQSTQYTAHEETTSSCAGAHAFDDFWEAWPKARRVGKKQAVAAWAKLKPDAETFGAIKAAIWRYNGEAKYLPHPHRWLRDRRWEDARSDAKPGAVVVTTADREHGEAARVAIAKARERDG